MDKNAKPKETIKKAIKIKLATLGTTLAIKLIPMLILIVTAVSIVDFIVEIFTAKNTPEKIYEELSIEDVADLIEIKGNKEDGYYLDFIEGIDEELEQLIETLNASGEYHNVPQDKEFLKKIIKAEAVIKFPNLGGKIPEGSTGFQGAIDVKRVTPNKAVGEMVNKGKGETNILEPESAYTDSQMTPKEEEIKKWEKGKELVLSADSILYEKKEGKWMQKYYKDSKTPIKIKYTNTVTYTGKYEVSEDKLNKTNVIYVEVKGKDLIDGEEVTGYIRSININIRSTNEGVWALEENTELEVIRDGVIVYEKFGNSNFNEKRDPSNMLEKIKAKTTDKIIYKGEYEKENKLTYEGDVYYIKVKIERENENGKTEIIDDDNTYLKFSDLEVKQESTEKEETSSRAKTKPKKEKITVGGDKEEYVVAIAAGHNNDNDKGAQEGDLIEEELTIKVAEKVEELVEEKYENVKVVQTGSTSKNPGGVQVRDRKELAKRAKPALCIQIHFNAADSPDANGVEAIYKDGDGISQQLAEILSRTISEEMELNDRKAGPDVEKCAVGSLGIIENAAYSKFPSVVTEGGFITNSKDAEVIRNGGIDKYAEGIVVGIKEYLEADHSGYSSHATGESTETSSIESRVFNMKYLSPEELEEMKSEDVDKAMKYFTLNDDKKLVSLSWTMQEDGTIEIKENSAVDFRTSLQKYMMPFEYLLYFYMDTEYRGFSEKLADIVLDSEIVMTLQDNVTTSQVSVTEETKTEKKNKVEWEITSSTGGAISETCGTRTDITYIETWCVKVYKDNSYSKKVLKMGDKEEIIVDAPGKVTETEDATYEEWITEDGTEKRKETKTHRISNSYDTSGDRKVEGVTNKFVDLYIKEEMNARIKEDWLFLILENNEKTVNLLDLTKYLMFLASNTDYGVTEFDFEGEFEFSSFSSIGSYFGDWDGTGGPEDFIRAVAPYAVIDMEQHQIYASVTIAQAIIESGWGKDSIAINYKNFFGMKAFGNEGNEFWSGESVPLHASEGGISNFRVYDSLKNSIYDHGRNFHVTSVYSQHGVLDCISQNLGPKEQLRRIAESGYAVYADGSITRPDGIRTYDQYLYEEFIVKYNLEQYDNMKPSDFQYASGDVLGVCEEVMNDMISRNVRYSLSSLTSGNIEQSAKDPYVCCGTYVAIVLYRAGLLSADQINAYNYNWTGSGGIPDMLANAGWKQVSHSEIQPGDVINDFGNHVAIYAGGDLIYDQNCGVISSSGRAPIGGPYEYWSRYNGNANVQVWRAP